MSTQGAITKLAVAAVKADPAIQPRKEGLDDDWANELADLAKAGTPYEQWPVVFKDADGNHWLSAGFHRHEGNVRALLTEANYEVREGTRQDAWLYARGDNRGPKKKPFSNASKRAAVLEMIDNPACFKWSARQIAEHLGVDPSWVSGLIRTRRGLPPDQSKQKGAESAAAVREEKKAQKEAGAGRPHPEGGPAAREPKEKPAVKDVPRDKLGRQLPGHLIGVFQNGEQIRKAAGQARSALSLARSANNLAAVGDFLRLNPGIEPALQDGGDSLMRASPYCCCPACGLRGDCTGDGGACPTCAGKGWLNYSGYLRLHPAMQEQAKSYAPSDGWEPDGDVGLKPGPSPAFIPEGAGLDAHGQKVPNELRNPFGDEYLALTAAEMRRMATALKSVSSWNPQLKPVWSDLELMADHLDGVRAYVVCRKCGGQGCQACNTAGWLPVWLKHELEPKRKK